MITYSEQTLQQQQITVQNPTTIVDASVPQTTTSSYTAVTTAVPPPKHDTTSFASDIFSGIVEEINKSNLSSSDTDSDDDLL